MGDHKTNINSLLRETMPAFPPLNRDVMAGLEFRCVPKRNVFFTTPTKEPDLVEQAAHAAACQSEGKEQVVHMLGEPLGEELCDVALLMVVGWMDTAAPQPTVGHMVLPGEVIRTDMKKFIENAEKSIGGGSRIIKPMIQLAQH